jgi:hypothetical protein
MNNIKPIDTLPNEVLEKHRVHSGNYKAGDFLIDNLDGGVYSVSNIEIDKIQGLEARLIKERQDTENEIKTVINCIFKEKSKLKDQIEEEKKDTDNRISEVWNKIHTNYTFLHDCIRENKFEAIAELKSLKKTLFWIFVVVSALFASIGIALNYILHRL